MLYVLMFLLGGVAGIVMTSLLAGNEEKTNMLRNRIKELAKENEHLKGRIRYLEAVVKRYRDLF